MKKTFILLSLFVLTIPAIAARTFPLNVRVLDTDTGMPIPCRVYIQDKNGKYYFVRSASPQGTALIYDKQNWANEKSVERHTTVSAHSFTVQLSPGEYTITVERGKEYFTGTQTVTIADKPVEITMKLKRWIDMAALGWYSGDTHVHRTIDELKNIQLAEDLNVSFPLTEWVTQAYLPPGRGDKNIDRPAKPELINIDDTHVIYPLNTEYEIFSVKDKSHTLGAVFILNHTESFPMGTPPVTPIAQAAEKQGALLELDKHNWPWSMMIAPIMEVDLYELSNNHIWRTEFAFADFGEKSPAYMKIQSDEKGFTELGWIDYGFQNYYALLNCGFRMRPTAGTANGVHPVPLGFGRVYVYLKKGFDYEQWVKGLDAGMSFVTTGPMMFVKILGMHPGHTFDLPMPQAAAYPVEGNVQSAYPLDRIEIVLNGTVIRVLNPENKKNRNGSYTSMINDNVVVNSTCWIAVRCFEKLPTGRIRFAHTAPSWIELEGKSIRPRKEQVRFLIERMEKQIQRSEGVLPEEAIDEYRQALEIYRAKAENAL